MKVCIDEIYEVRYWAIECPNCEEQVELDERQERRIICPFCNEIIDITKQ